MDIKFDFSKINIPNNNSRVYKDECLLCYDNPESEGGLNICLNTFQGFCPEHVKLYHKKTNNRFFLNIKRIKTENPEKNNAKQPERLAIGLPGGFSFENKYIYQDLLSLVCLDPINCVVTLPNNDLPEKVKMAIDGIVGSADANKKDDIVAWEGEQLKSSKYTENLVQINPDNIKVPRAGWQCKHCDKDINLWLCLTCGNIGCGRRYDDGTGGNNHAIDHHKSTGHPLVVKLGTITAEGKADVWDYFANDLVINAHLEKHLAFFGINIAEMKKTDKSMAELQLQANINFDSQRIQASGTDLFGSGFTGLNNLGNTCYMASVVQSLFNIPQFKARYFDLENSEYLSSTKDALENLDVQLTKVANGLFSGKYSKEVYTEQPKKDEEHIMEKVLQEQVGITPRSLKSLVGKGHHEFSTAAQQDALEFLQWILQLIERNELTKQNSVDVTKLFKFQLEERYQCSESAMVKYKHRIDNLITLPVPLDKAFNKEEWEAYEQKQKVIREEQKKEQELKKLQQANPDAKIDAQVVPPQPKKEEPPVRPRVQMADCISAFAEAELVQGFYSTAIKRNTNALKTSKLSTFPDYLCVSVRRFILDGWVPRKLDVFIENAQEIDISSLRGNGPQPNEQILPEEAEKPVNTPPPAPKLDINEEYVQGLEQMGFGRNRCMRAVLATKNAGIEAAMNWIFDNSQAADIDDPLPQLQQPAQTQPTLGPAMSEESIQLLESMGFDRKSSIVALKQTNGNTERAIDWIFNHQDEVQRLVLLEEAQERGSAQEVVAPQEKLSPAQQAERDRKSVADGAGKYELIGFISHIGSSTLSGHYVCHLKKEGKWTIFNDRKVSACDNPPFDMGYIYLYQRK